LSEVLPPRNLGGNLLITIKKKEYKMEHFFGIYVAIVISVIVLFICGLPWR